MSSDLKEEGPGQASTVGTSAATRVVPVVGEGRERGWVGRGKWGLGTFCGMLGGGVDGVKREEEEEEAQLAPFLSFSAPFLREAYAHES